MARQRKAPTSPARDLKLLISAAAVSATLGGWAALAPQPEVATPVVSAADLAQPVAPLPTLVPLVGAPPEAGAAGLAEPQSAPREVRAAPARPAPITTTRSSR